MKTVEIKFNWTQVAWLVGGLGLLILLWQLKGIVVIFFLAYIISTGLRRVVDRLDRKLSRGLATFLVIASFFLVFGVFVFLVASQLTPQIVALAEQLPVIADNALNALAQKLPFLAGEIEALRPQGGSDPAQVAEQLKNFFSGAFSSERLVSIATSAFGAGGRLLDLVISAFTVVVVAAYLTQRGDSAYEDVLRLGKPEWHDPGMKLFKSIEGKLGAWVNGQLLLMLLIGVSTYVVVLLPALFLPDYKLHEFALLIAIFAGLLEAVPTIGPLITFIFAAALGLGTSGLGAVVYLMVAFLLLQNLESLLFVPQVMRQAVGIDPIVSILGIVAGLQLAGIAGAILVIPLLSVLEIGINFIMAQRRKHLPRQRENYV